MSTRKITGRRRPILTPEAHAALMALDAQIAAEDAEDFRRERRRIKAGLPEPPREGLRTFAGWTDGGVTHAFPD
ncbi:hypothetical protein FAM23877_11390 [Propionibacterium freudenreichii]|uniref:hypothetical protein n=1 Tax=Propionibacterium freudenreichii TaxID=1744 RepID=UPI002484F7E3|nr:hypothetical protein [Propionibacterium freudenreichii]MDK9640017.1 hypothetical protein [Propionibacterium freudenreichii]WGU90237.1 hypothetical protein FAM23877_11390 [Propionibacterium freudenreichii]